VLGLKFTHASFLDLVGNLNEEFLVLGSIFAADEDLNGKTTPFQLLKMFRYRLVRVGPLMATDKGASYPSLRL
jgi:hypothetical protein